MPYGLRRGFESVTSPAILAELLAKLAAPKFGFAPAKPESAERRDLREIARVVEPDIELPVPRRRAG